LPSAAGKIATASPLGRRLCVACPSALPAFRPRRRPRADDFRNSSNRHCTCHFRFRVNSSTSGQWLPCSSSWRDSKLCFQAKTGAALFVGADPGSGCQAFRGPRAGLPVGPCEPITNRIGYRFRSVSDIRVLRSKRIKRQIRDPRISRIRPTFVAAIATAMLPTCTQSCDALSSGGIATDLFAHPASIYWRDWLFSKAHSSSPLLTDSDSRAGTGLGLRLRLPLQKGNYGDLPSHTARRLNVNTIIAERPATSSIH
jgi:hypothetical protein